MKCARCGHDSKYPERAGRKCPGCGGRFAFEPREGDPINDVAFDKALDWVSSGGTVAFTMGNLHHAVARRIAPKSFGCLLYAPFVVGILGGMVAVGAGRPGLAATLLLGFFGLGAALLVGNKRRPLGLTVPAFQALYRRWVDAHGRPPKLIPPPADRPAQLDPALTSELASYSFDRAVICDRAETVDLLLANDFHFENNCAVLSFDGHPRHVFATVRAMLRRNPRLEVFALHDATPFGCKLAWLLRHQPDWFEGTEVRVFDVALRPGQAARQPRLLWRTREDVEKHPALTDRERHWLGRYRMELAAFRPEQLVKRLFRAMNHMPEAASGDGGGGDLIWTSEATASDGGADSFG